MHLHPLRHQALVTLALCLACANAQSRHLTESFPVQPKPAKKQSKQPASRHPAHKLHAKPPLRAYRTGHGNHGLGTLKAPPIYKQPLPVEPPVTGLAAIEFPEQLDQFFIQLRSFETKAPGAAETLRILQFGDSHTAADMFTARMRTLFQSRFGNGGAGFSYAGHPFAGYRILGTSRGQSGGWQNEGVHFTQIVDNDLGLGGVATTSYAPGQTLTLDAPCSTLELDYLDQPDGGSFSLFADGALVTTVSTANPLAPETLTQPCSPSAATASDPAATTIHRFEVRSDASGPVRLFGFTTLQPGITYEALGLNGAEASLIARWNQPIFTHYLAQAQPALIVLAYGTNEAGNHNWTYEAYRQLLSRIVDQLHATVPSASILVIGPPDRSMRTGRRRHISWSTYMETLHITEAQRDTCRTHGCSFWSWRDRMGGLGSMNRWVNQGLAQPDHTHFTSAGYVRLADFLYSDMIAAYNAWKLTRQPPSPETNH